MSEAAPDSANVVAFIASNTDANEQPLPDGGLYVTYVGLAGACNGISGTDVPFKNVITWHWAPPRPIWPRMPIGPEPIVRAPIVPSYAPIWRFGNVQTRPWMRSLVRAQARHGLRADPRPELRPELSPAVRPEVRPEVHP